MQLPHNIWLIYIQDFLTVKLGHIWHKGNVTVLYTIYTKNSKNTATKYRTCYSDCVIYIPTCVYQREILAKMSWCNCLNIYLLSNDNYHIQYIYTIQRPELSSVKKIFKFQILTSLSFFIAAIYRIIKCSDILAIAYFIEKVTHVKLSFMYVFIKNTTVLKPFHSENLLCKYVKYMSRLQKTRDRNTQGMALLFVVHQQKRPISNISICLEEIDGIRSQA